MSSSRDWPTNPLHDPVRPLCREIFLFPLTFVHCEIAIVLVTLLCFGPFYIYCRQTLLIVY